MPERMNGIVKWWDNKKGYGFITGTDGRDYFCHWAQLESKHKFKKLGKEWEVSFLPSQTEKGWMAVSVQTVKVVYPEKEETNGNNKGNADSPS